MILTVVEDEYVDLRTKQERLMGNLMQNVNDLQTRKGNVPVIYNTTNSASFIFRPGEINASSGLYAVSSAFSLNPNQVLMPVQNLENVNIDLNTVTASKFYLSGFLDDSVYNFYMNSAGGLYDVSGYALLSGIGSFNTPVYAQVGAVDPSQSTTALRFPVILQFPIGNINYSAGNSNGAGIFTFTPFNRTIDLFNYIPTRAISGGMKQFTTYSSGANTDADRIEYADLIKILNGSYTQLYITYYIDSTTSGVSSNFLDVLFAYPGSSKLYPYYNGSTFVNIVQGYAAGVPLLSMQTTASLFSSGVQFAYLPANRLSL